MSDSRAFRPGNAGILPLAAAFGCMVTLFSGCASDQYAGIPLKSGAAPVEIQALARRAQAGDQDAQLALGRVFETGDGVDLDIAMACRVYLAGGPVKSKDIWLYIPTTKSVRRFSKAPREDRNQELAFQSYLCRRAGIARDAQP